jgi:hypothetical protein
MSDIRGLEALAKRLDRPESEWHFDSFAVDLAAFQQAIRDAMDGSPDLIVVIARRIDREDAW